MRFFKLFLVGFLMGIADLIPGISGGSVAFICGIYEELLIAIKSLQLGSFKRIQWSFLLSLGGGLVFAILLFSRVVYFLLLHHQTPLFAFLFGVIAVSAVFCLRKAKIERPTHYALLVLGACASLAVTFLPTSAFFSESIAGLMVAGSLAALAMLLPGISGSYLLHVLGVYHLMLTALAVPKGGLSLLAFLGFGVAFGFVIFSRLVHVLLTHFRSITLAVLIGFMIGGLRSLWPFYSDTWVRSLLFMALGVLFMGVAETSVYIVSKVSSRKIDSVIK